MKTNTIIAALLIFCAPVYLRTQPIFAKGAKELFVNGGNGLDSGPDKALNRFSQALQKHKDAPLFRFVWDYGATTQGTGYSGVALYNRQIHTLKYYFQATDLVSDKQHRVLMAQSVNSILFTGVTDAMLYRLIKAEGNRGKEPQNVILNIVKYGAKKHQLLKKYRTYPSEDES